MSDRKYHEENDVSPKDQLRKEIEQWSRLKLNKGDRDSGIQTPDANAKRSRQRRFTDPTLATW